MSRMLVVFCLFLPCFAQSATKATIHGILHGYDKNIVMIKSGKSIIRVPKSSLETSLKGITVGVAEVQARVTYKQFIELNDRPAKK